MAFTPQYFSNYNFSNELCEFPSPVAVGDCGGSGMWSEESPPFFDNGVLNMVPSESGMAPWVSTISFPERLGVSDMAVPVLPESNMGLCSIAGADIFAARNLPEVCEFGEECTGFESNFCFDHFGTGNNLGIQGKPVQEIEEPTMKVGRYSVEERKDKILKYLKKRNQRNFNKTIKYVCRKTLADKRVRVRGRFAKNNEHREEEEMIKNNNSHQEGELFYRDDVQIKHDEEDWLQEAMASFMYLPHIAG